MLIQNSFCSSIDTTPFRESEYENLIAFDWVPRTESCKMFHKHSQGSRLNYTSTKDDMRPDRLLEVNAKTNCSEVSTTNRTYESAPTSIVYSRRKQRRKADVPEETKIDQNGLSVIKSATVSVAEMNQDGLKQSEPEIQLLDGVVKNRTCKTRRKDGINDGCSSFKSCKKTSQDESDKCSSSGFVREEISAKDFCVSILKNNGLLEGSWHTRNRKEIEIDNSNSSNQLCKVCGKLETAVRMLICDQCEEASHTYCCNILQKKKIPVDDEWFCPSCLRQKRKFLKDTTRRRQTKINNSGKCKNWLSKSDSNPILKMLRDSESYTSGVKIGANFQAEVPDFSGSTISDGSPIREPDEMDLPECMHELNARKPYRFSSIGNWLQCRAEGFDGTICGKWRRAPLSEAQTADWECFSCICWDPSRADCAVPQELETGEIMKQLKYIEMLRPQLDAKRRKVDGSRGSASEGSAEAKANSN